MGKMVGIDLGTTNTVVAIADGPRPRVLESREGKSQFRSAVSLKKSKSKKNAAGSEEILVGDTAVDNWGMMPKDTILSVKRLMGRGISDPEVQRIRRWATYQVVEPTSGTKDSVRVVINEKQYSPIDVSAMILQKAKENAEFRLGESVTHAVITVPAYFSHIQRDATRKAALKAGLKVIKILDEPTAAALAFGFQSCDANPRNLVVYDLGGGTFDVSVLMFAGNVFAPLNVEGDMWLGGDDFDQTIIDYALQWIRNEYDIDPIQDARFMAELKRAAQTVKERLAAANSANLIISNVLRDTQGNLLDVDLEITRKEFERMIIPLIGRYRKCSCNAVNLREDTCCAECGQTLRGPEQIGKALQLVDKAIKGANLTRERIHYVLMAGNSTIVPLIQREMEAEFGPGKVRCNIHPKYCVAMGAAIAAQMIGYKVVCQARDPADPTDSKRECGHVNDPDAVACAQCGASLVGLAEDPNATTPKNESIFIGGQVASIAPFSYGTQTAGDTYNLFIKKGEPYPTEKPKLQTFYTRTPNQRMVSIPVYGGDCTERASANELQGQAFAVLPAGLPQETPIRVQLTLDGNGVFKVGAWLGDGKSLEPWIVKGETDAKAIEVMEQLEQRLTDPAANLPPQAVAEAEHARERVFNRLQRNEFDEALYDIVSINKNLDQASAAEQQGSLHQKAENLIGYTEYILRQYSWAIEESNQLYRLTQLVEETKAALKKGDIRRLQEKVNALDKETDELPDAVRILIAMRGAISERIQRMEPTLADQLLREMDEVETALRRGDKRAKDKFEAFAIRIMTAIQNVESKRSGGLRCSNGHAVKSGQRFCPECNEDTWILGKERF